MGNDYQDNRKRLSDKLKNEPLKTPIQEVRPVEEPLLATADPTPIKKDAHINFWVPEELMERLKVHAARNKKTIKQIGIEALESYLAKPK